MFKAKTGGDRLLMGLPDVSHLVWVGLRGGAGLASRAVLAQASLPALPVSAVPQAGNAPKSRLDRDGVSHRKPWAQMVFCLPRCLQLLWRYTKGLGASMYVFKGYTKAALAPRDFELLDKKYFFVV